MRGIDNLYGDGTTLNYNDYKILLEKNNNIYNLHNTLLQLTNHILDGNAEILQTWKNISKMSLKNDTNLIKEETVRVAKLEEEIRNYNKLMKEYLFKIEKLFKESGLSCENNTSNNKIGINLDNKKKDNNLNNKDIIKKKNKILVTTLKIITILIILIIFYLINRNTNIVNKIKSSVKMSIKKIKK